MDTSYPKVEITLDIRKKNDLYYVENDYIKGLGSENVANVTKQINLLLIFINKKAIENRIFIEEPNSIITCSISIREDTDDHFLYTLLSQDSISIITLQSAINLHNLEILDAKLEKINNKPKPPGLKEWIDFHDEKKKLNPEHDELTHIYTKEQTKMFFPNTIFPNLDLLISSLPMQT